MTLGVGLRARQLGEVASIFSHLRARAGDESAAEVIEGDACDARPLARLRHDDEKPFK
jgi:hypothetical protein